MVHDSDVYRVASTLVKDHGRDEARSKAQLTIEAAQIGGKRDMAALWQRIAEAIDRVPAQPTDVGVLH